ncbi:hypothetical protein C8N40_110120 [Pontibacter mucosus]|uniref:Uncharacterized protein n=1 Tax=Pontibacter mucosus TaxID=1649266 RepID=A0A2T5YDR8_9BACT|nr:hypothetical protein [Pontibacter mucosus]PTX14691.1 hypothetical protein C8N40_110120 [Pontibacter mucosus]
MKSHTTDIALELTREIPIEKLNEKHLEFITSSHKRYLWDDEDYMYTPDDMLYCNINRILVPIIMNEFLLIGWYEHTTIRSANIPSAANFYVHMLSNQVFILANFDHKQYILAAPYPSSAEAAMNFVESGNDLCKAYRREYKQYLTSRRKGLIEDILHDE